jgi:short-subunit dehydrogenase
MKIQIAELFKYSRTKLLLRGLPYNIATHIVRKACIKERDTKTFEDFNKILRIMKEAIESKYNISCLVNNDIKKDMTLLVQAMSSN